jgi:hypothetical protein
MYCYDTLKAADAKRINPKWKKCATTPDVNSPGFDPNFGWIMTGMTGQKGVGEKSTKPMALICRGVRDSDSVSNIGASFAIGASVLLLQLFAIALQWVVEKMNNCCSCATCCLRCVQYTWYIILGIVGIVMMATNGSIFSAAGHGWGTWAAAFVVSTFQAQLVNGPLYILFCWFCWEPGCACKSAKTDSEDSAEKILEERLFTDDETDTTVSSPSPPVATEQVEVSMHVGTSPPPPPPPASAPPPPPPAPLPAGWSESQDPNSGKTYYFHQATNETRWERPTQ